MRAWAAILLPVAAASFMTAFDGAAVQLILPVIVRELHIDMDSAHWIMTAFLLMSSATLLQAGRAGDVLGRERVFRFGVGLFAVASALCAVMPGLWWLVGARAIQGFGSALVTANSSAILVEAFPDRRGKMLGLGNISLALAIVAGPPLGALLAKAVSWRLIFVVAIPVGCAIWLVTRDKLPRSPRRDAPLDWMSGLLSMLGLASIFVAGTFGERWGWVSVPTLVLFGVGAGLVAAFIVLQSRSSQPLIERSLITSRLFISGLIATVCAYASLFTVTISMPFFILDVQHRGTVSAGLLIGFVPLALAITAPIAGIFTDRIGSRWICTVALALLTGALFIIITGGRDISTGLLILSLLLIGMGLGGFEAPNDVDVLGSLPENRLSAGTAVLNAVRSFGMTLGVAVGGTLLQVGLRHGEGSLEARTTLGVHEALWAGAGLAAAGSIAAAIRPSGPQRKGKKRD